MRDRLHQRFARLAAIVLVCQAGADARAQGGSLALSDACSPLALQLASKPVLAHGLAMRCAGDLGVYRAAIDKLNAMPLPADVPQVSLQREDDRFPSENVGLAADVFFYLDEAYPSPIALEKLAELVRRVGEGYRIDRVLISSSENAIERDPVASDVARLRSDFMTRYFIAAGIPHQRIFASEQAPDHEDSVEGRARDRCARVIVNVRRTKRPS
jgi:hypothetical protein